MYTGKSYGFAVAEAMYVRFFCFRKYFFREEKQDIDASYRLSRLSVSSSDNHNIQIAAISWTITYQAESLQMQPSSIMSIVALRRFSPSALIVAYSALSICSLFSFVVAGNAGAPVASDPLAQELLSEVDALLDKGEWNQVQTRVADSLLKIKNAKSKKVISTKLKETVGRIFRSLFRFVFFPQALLLSVLETVFF